METFCIFIHDIGYCGMDYLTDKNHEGHEILGAEIAYKLFGKKAYDLCIGHRTFGEKLEIPDEYSHILMPIFLLRIERLAENDKNLMTYKEWGLYCRNRWQRRLEGEIFGGQFNDVFKE